MINLNNLLYEITNENDNILIVTHNKNYFNPLDDYSHIIKKKNLKIYLLIDNSYIINKLKENIKGEECEKNIYLLESSTHQSLLIPCDIYNLIYIYHIDSLEYLSNLFNYFKNNIISSSLIYIYENLSNEKYNKIINKNNIRNNINLLLNINISSNVYQLSDFLNIINKNLDTIKIKSFNIIKKNNYIFYGNNILYEIILEKY